MIRLSEIAGLRSMKTPVHVALGVFDGVHLGHRAVIERALQARAAAGGSAGVLTFDPNPLQVLAPEKAPAQRLSSLSAKARLLAGMGLDFLLVLPFTREFSEMRAEDFVAALVAAGARTLAAGEDWRFGHGRSGDRILLDRLAAETGFVHEAVAPVMAGGERISSTRIRQAIRDGNMDAAARMLGRRYSVTGEVIHGEQLGRQLGFPTANLDPGDEPYPPDGVWTAWVILPGGSRHPALVSLGTRPTVSGRRRVLEAHLLDWSGDLYGKTLEVEWGAFLRGQQHFESLEDLKRAMVADEAAARKLLQT